MATLSLDLDISAAEAARGFKVGILTFVVGLVAAVMLVNPNEDDEVFETSDGRAFEALTYGQLDTESISPPKDFELGGWLYHKAHFASIDVSLTNGGGDDLAFAMDPSGLTMLVPILVLTAAGFFLAAKGSGTTLDGSAVNGSLVFLGYLPVAFVSSYVLYYQADPGPSYVGLEAQPDATSVVLFTGIAFPVIFGAIGGAIQHAIGDDAGDDDGR